MPASVWVIQITVSRGWQCGTACGLGLAAGQLPWSLAAGLILFEFNALWQNIDLPLRAVGAAFLIWMSIRNARAQRVEGLHLKTEVTTWDLLKTSFWRSLLMPWRLPLWLGILLSVSIHLRGPGWEVAPLFAVGTLLGQLGWFAHFILVAGLFGNRVPEAITLKSLNKLRLLATVVLGGLALIILAPVAFPPLP
jgi:threonine/homoserine/homoserine lactone efflux protein